MAICRGDLVLWQRLQGRLPENPDVLEIGQANLFGDFPITEVPGLEKVTETHPFALAKLFYKAILNYNRLDAIDLEGRSDAWKLNLNQPLCLERKYDIIINTGTNEHVFDQRQVFETIHDWTKPGGLMTHCFPVQGCTDHGFYTYSPCLIRELARANDYQLLTVVEGRYENDVVVYIAWRKQHDKPFVVPIQKVSKGILGGEFKPVETK